MDTAILETMNLLNALTQPLMVVFDNCQFAANQAEFQNIVMRLSAVGNHMVTVVLIGTVHPDLPFSSLKAKRRYFELSFQDLAFSREETAAFFNDLHHMNLEDSEIEVIHSRTGGWVTSYQLIVDFLQKYTVDNDRKIGLNFISDIPDIFDYLSQEIVGSESAELQDFMIKTSPMAEMTAEILNVFLGIQNGVEILDNLLTRRGFIFRAENGTVKYHPLLRRFLYEKYLRQDAGSVRNAHLQLATIYQTYHQYVTAFAHAVAGDDYVCATEIMRLIEQRYTPYQILDIIDGHLEEVSPVLLFSNTSLFLLHCTPEKLLMEFIIPLQEALLVEHDFLRSARLQNRLAAIYFHCGELSKSRELLEASSIHAASLHDYALLAFNYQLLADCDLAEGRCEDGIQHAKQALFLAEKFGITSMKIHTLEVFSRLCIAVGQIGQAESYINQALDMTSSGSYVLYWIYAAKSQVLLCKKLFSEAIDFAKLALKIVQQGNSSYGIAYANWVLGNAYLEDSQLSQAKSHLQSAYQYSAHCGLLRYHTLKAQIKVYHASGDKENARKTKTELYLTCQNYKYNWFFKHHQSFSRSIQQREDDILEIHTLGAFTIARGGRTIHLKRSASLRLLQFFITNRSKWVNKDIIVETVFPGSQYANTNYFNVALSALRKNLEPELSSGRQSHYILRTQDRYRLNIDRIDLDVANFDSACMHSKNVSHNEQIMELLQLDQLYKGDFFEEYPYESFLEVERERVRLQYIDVLHQIALYYKQHGEYYKSIEYYDKILRFDPYLEEIYLEFITLLLTIRAGSNAKQVAQRMVKFIEKELGVPCIENLSRLFSLYHYYL